MSRLIDADELKNGIMNHCLFGKEWDRTLAICEIDSAPTVDAVPVVRCKDCKHCEYPMAKKEWCKKGHLYRNGETWFCADGERKESDSDG